MRKSTLLNLVWLCFSALLGLAAIVEAVSCGVWNLLFTAALCFILCLFLYYYDDCGRTESIKSYLSRKFSK